MDTDTKGHATLTPVAEHPKIDKFMRIVDRLAFDMDMDKNEVMSALFSLMYMETAEFLKEHPEMRQELITRWRNAFHDFIANLEAGSELT